MACQNKRGINILQHRTSFSASFSLFYDALETAEFELIETIEFNVVLTVHRC